MIETLNVFGKTLHGRILVIISLGIICKIMEIATILGHLYGKSDVMVILCESELH